MTGGIAMEEKSYIPLLVELTKKLSPAPADNQPNEIIIGDGKTPPMIGRGLYKTDEIAILQVFLPKGNILPVHKHDQKEWLICFHGKIELRLDGEIMILSPGSCKYLPEGTAHESVALEDSKTIVVTIPADPGFPNV